MLTTNNLEYNDVDDVDEFSDQDQIDSPGGNDVRLFNLLLNTL